MAQLPIFPNFANHDDERPLPVIVAEKWRFPLAYIETESELLYAIQDWIRGIISAADARTIWADIKRRSNLNEMLDSIQQLPYTAKDGKTYQVDFTNDKGLYLIAQHLRTTKSRPVLDEIKNYLAASGAFVDLVRREPETVITSGAIDPDEVMEAAIKAYRSQGKSDSWIQARLQGIVTRKQFVDALNEAVVQVLSSVHFAIATDEVYKGLWGRTAAILKAQLDLSPKANLRDHQPELALIYQRIAEAVSKEKLGERTELTWAEARQIVRIVADLIGEQAQSTSQFLNTDLATGRPLLARGKTSGASDGL